MHNILFSVKNNDKGGIVMSVIQKIALCFTIIGAINWGLVGIFDFNLVEYLFAAGSAITRGIYILIAICGIFNVVLLFLRNKHKIVEEDFD